MVALAVVGLLGLVGAVLAAGAWLAAAAHVAAAADMSALAGARHVYTASACERASQVVDSHGFVVESCQVDRFDVTIVVVADPPKIVASLVPADVRVRAVARAGPIEQLPA